jgi:hypothetical protein
MVYSGTHGFMGLNNTQYLFPKKLQCIRWVKGFCLYLNRLNASGSANKPDTKAYLSNILTPLTGIFMSSATLLYGQA